MLQISYLAGFSLAKLAAIALLSFSVLKFKLLGLGCLLTSLDVETPIEGFKEMWRIDFVHHLPTAYLINSVL